MISLLTKIVALFIIIAKCNSQITEYPTGNTTQSNVGNTPSDTYVFSTITESTTRVDQSSSRSRGDQPILSSDIDELPLLTDICNTYFPDYQGTTDFSDKFFNLSLTPTIQPKVLDTDDIVVHVPQFTFKYWTSSNNFEQFFPYFVWRTFKINVKKNESIVINPSISFANFTMYPDRKPPKAVMNDTEREDPRLPILSNRTSGSQDINVEESTEQPTESPSDYFYSADSTTEDYSSYAENSIDRKIVNFEMGKCILDTTDGQNTFKILLGNMSFQRDLQKLYPLLTTEEQEGLLKLNYSCVSKQENCDFQLLNNYSEPVSDLQGVTSKFRIEMDAFLSNFKLTCVQQMSTQAVCKDQDRSRLVSLIREDSSKNGFVYRLWLELAFPFTTELEKVSEASINGAQLTKVENSFGNPRAETYNDLSIECVINERCLNFFGIKAPDIQKIETAFNVVKEKVKSRESFEKFASLPICCLIGCSKPELCNEEDQEFIKTADDCPERREAVDDIFRAIESDSIKKAELFDDIDDKKLECITERNGCPNVVKFVSKYTMDQIRQYKIQNDSIFGVRLGCLLLSDLYN